MIVTVEDITKMIEDSINDDTAIIENYSKVVEIIDKINIDQAKAIFDQLVNNHEVSSQWARNFQAKSNLFAKQARKGGAPINPMAAQRLEGLQAQAEQLSDRRTELELEIGKKMLEKGFLDKKTYDKYYPE